MTYIQAVEALKFMENNHTRWYRLNDGRITTRTDCKEIIEFNNATSTETLFEQARRDI